MKNKVIVIAAIVGLFSLSAEARREVRQQARIRQGVKSGELTQHEARKLNRGQARVDRAQSAAKVDGVVTDAEAAKINKLQSHQSKEIYQQKHDNQN